MNLSTSDALEPDYDENQDIYVTQVQVKGTSQNKAWPTKFQIQFSDDGKEWRTVHTAEYPAADSPGTTREITLDPNSAHGKLMRIFITEMNSNAVNATGVSIDEIVVMGYQGERMVTASIDR